jgi:hypothetical protein
MGYFKQRELENEGFRSIAEEVAIRAGHLARCPNCGTTYDPLTCRQVEAYRLANALISQGHELVGGLGDEDRRRLTDAIKDIAQQFPNRCRCGAHGLKW